MSPPLERIGARRLSRSSLLDVEREDLAGSGGGLVEHAPQRLLTQRQITARELALDCGLRQILRGVDVFLASLAADRDRGRWPAPVIATSAQPRVDRGTVAIPRRLLGRGPYDIDIIQIPAVIAICVITAPSGLLALAGGWSRPPRFSRRCCAGRPCARSVSGRQAAVDLRARAAGRPRRARVLGRGAAALDAAVRHEATYQRHPQSTEPRHALPPGVVLTAIAAALPLGPVRIPRACARLATTPCCWRRPPAPLREAAALPAVCATMHAARDAGFLVGCARLGVPDARARGSAPRWIQPPRSGASRASRLTLRR